MIETGHKLEQHSFIQPRKLANKNGELRYNWTIAEFTRLDGLLYSDKGEVSVHLTGRLDDRKRYLVEANIVAEVELECQTSFEPIKRRIDTQITYCMVVSEDQIASLDDEYEALLVEDGQVDIKAVIEDELILCLPVVANKSSDELAIQMSYGDLPKEAEEVKKNPFTVLEGFANKGKSDKN